MHSQVARRLPPFTALLLTVTATGSFLILFAVLLFAYRVIVTFLFPPFTKYDINYGRTPTFEIEGVVNTAAWWYLWLPAFWVLCDFFQLFTRGVGTPSQFWFDTKQRFRF